MANHAIHADGNSVALHSRFPPVMATLALAKVLHEK